MIVVNRPQTTKWRLRIACWITKATNTHSQYVIIIAFPLQRWLHGCPSMLRYMSLPVLFFTNTTKTGHSVLLQSVS